MSKTKPLTAREEMLARAHAMIPVVRARAGAAEAVGRIPEEVICISGYAEETFRNRLGEGQDIHFLPKPFPLTQLAGKVKEVMERVPA